MYDIIFVYLLFESSCHHHSNKLFVIDVSISIYVCFSNHFIHLFFCEFLAQIGHYMSEFCSRDEAISIPVKDFEGLNELLLSVRIFHLPGHQWKKLREVNRTVTISIHFVNHILQFSLGRILPQRSHYCT